MNKHRYEEYTLDAQGVTLRITVKRPYNQLRSIHCSEHPELSMAARQVLYRMDVGPECSCREVYLGMRNQGGGWLDVLGMKDRTPILHRAWSGEYIAATKLQRLRHVWERCTARYLAMQRNVPLPRQRWAQLRSSAFMHLVVRLHLAGYMRRGRDLFFPDDYVYRDGRNGDLCIDGHYHTYNGSKWHKAVLRVHPDRLTLTSTYSRIFWSRVNHAFPLDQYIAKR